MINRAAVILKYKAPAVKWINEADPNAKGREFDISLESVNEERTVYLIPEEDADNDAAFKKWIRRYYSTLFEWELEGWYTDEEMWPKDRTLELFNEWFEVQCHTVIEDTVGDPIEDDET